MFKRKLTLSNLINVVVSHLFLRCSAKNERRNDVKQFLIQKGLKSNVVLTDLHLTGLFKVATFTAIDLDLVHGRY